MRLLWYAGVSFSLGQLAPRAKLCSLHQAGKLTLLQSSAALAAGVVTYAFNQRANFYSAMVYLSQNNLSLMVSSGHSARGAPEKSPRADKVANDNPPLNRSSSTSYFSSTARLYTDCSDYVTVNFDPSKSNSSTKRPGSP